jgi:hypothetical protein
MRFTKALICGVLLFVAAASLPAWATMLVVIYTPDGYWIGTDSLRSNKTTSLGTVCKVHETKWGLLLKGGEESAVNFEGEKFSTDQEVQTLITTSTSANDFKAKLKSKFHYDIDAELAYDVVKANESIPSHGAHTRPPTPEDLESIVFNTPLDADRSISMDRTILLMDSDTEGHKGQAFHMVPIYVPIRSSFSIQPTYHYIAAIDLDWHTISTLPTSARTARDIATFPPSVRIFMAPITYARPDEWVQQHPQDALLEMLRTGHDFDPIHIGEPYVIVHVVTHAGRPDKVQWISKGVCPLNGKNKPW